MVSKDQTAVEAKETSPQNEKVEVAKTKAKEIGQKAWEKAKGPVKDKAKELGKKGVSKAWSFTKNKALPKGKALVGKLIGMIRK